MDGQADYLFKKLTPFEGDDGEFWTVPKLMEEYMERERENGCAWFSMPYHISESKAKEYNGKIRNGERVRILFGLNDETVDNDIGYSADVLELHTFQELTPCPGKAAGLEAEGTNRTWFKMRNLKRETAIRASMMRFISTGANLKEVICASQCHFGYVSFQ